MIIIKENNLDLNISKFQITITDGNFDIEVGAEEILGIWDKISRIWRLLMIEYPHKFVKKHSVLYVPICCER